MNTIRAFSTTPQPQPAAPATSSPAREAYTVVDQLILQVHPALKAEPTLATQLSELSSSVKTEFKEQVVGTTQLPQLAEEGRRAVLAALAAGLIAGAMDGLVLLSAEAAAPQPSPAPAPPTAAGTIGEAVDEMLRKLAEDLAAARDSFKDTGAEALQQMSEFAKGLGESMVDNADMFAKPDEHSVEELQGYLVAAFGLGYGIGAVDSAIVAVAGEEPRN